MTSIPKEVSHTVNFTHITIVSSDEQLKVPFPWSAFLSQPICNPRWKLIINPIKFQRVYEIRLLESCLRQLPAANYRKLRDK